MLSLKNKSGEWRPLTLWLVLLIGELWHDASSQPFWNQWHLRFEYLGEMSIFFSLWLTIQHQKELTLQRAAQHNWLCKLLLARAAELISSKIKQPFKETKKFRVDYFLEWRTIDLAYFPFAQWISKCEKKRLLTWARYKLHSVSISNFCIKKAVIRKLLTGFRPNYSATC